MKYEWTAEQFSRWRTGQGKRWTQAFTADRLGVSRKQVNEWENGKTGGVDRRTVLACNMITRAILNPLTYLADPIWNARLARLEGEAQWEGLPVKYWVSYEYLTDLIQTGDHIRGDEAVKILKQHDLFIADDLSLRAITGNRDENGHIGLISWI